MSEESSDVSVFERVRFRVVGDGGESSLGVADAGGRGVGAVFCEFEGGGMGVPSHIAWRVIATALCLFHCLSLGLVSSSSSWRLCLAGALP